MPSVSHHETIAAPIGETWDFVKRMENWATLLPGYESMTIQSDTDSEWRIRGDVGILTKLVTMQVHIDEWVELSHVSFSVVCKEEPLQAKGSLIATGESDDASTLVFNLDANAGGMLGPVVNALLKTVMPRMAGDFATSIKREIESRATEPSVS
jgi:carbon monoxide dehydrogenase subunit G